MSEEKLYRVYIKQDQEGASAKPLYLPSGPGVPLEEAERQAKAAAANTFIHCVYEPKENDE